MRKSYKIVTLGASGCGKTSIINRYVRGIFSEIEVSTIGAAFQIRNFNYPDGVKVRLDFWDCSGQDRFDSIAPIYYRAANGCLIVYDICNYKSFEKAKAWVDTILDYDQKGVMVVALIGNKVDLNNERCVKKQEAEDYAKQKKLLFAEVSAKTSDNLDVFFQKLAGALRDVIPDDVEDPSLVNIVANRQEQSRCCSYIPYY